MNISRIVFLLATSADITAKVVSENVTIEPGWFSMKFSSTLLFLLLCLSAQVTWADQPVSLGLISIVSTADPRFRVPVGATVSWKESAVKVYLDDRIDSAPMISLYRSEITSALSDKGFKQVTGPDSDFELGFLLALPTSLGDEQILQQFGFNPGLQAGGGNRLEKGTLVIILIDPRSGRSLWRGALQAAVDFDANDTARKQRAKLAVDQLIELLPDVP